MRKQSANKYIFLSLLCAVFFLLAGFQDAHASGEPSTPTNLVTTPVSDTEINLTWDREGNGETSITVWRLYNSSYEKVVILPAGSNIFTDSSLYPDTLYSFQLTADNANGSSLPTQSVSATTNNSGATAAAATNFLASPSSPYLVNLSWNDSNTMSRNWHLERSTDGVSYSVIAVISSAGTSVSYVDTPLSSESTYHYRTRLVTGSNYSDYNSPVSATTQTRPIDVPLEPVELSAATNSATSTTLNWTDTNGGSATYLVETAPFVWTPTLPTWTQVTETAAGATNYSLTTLAEKFYWIRVRAKNSNGNSGYSNTVKIRTASVGTGSPKTYEIGPGKTYTSLGALDWTVLGPGDTVNIYPNRNGGGAIIPYYEKPMISVRGTAASPITIQGIADPDTGQLPTIDGTNAVEVAQWNRSYMPIHDVALVLISYRQTQTDSGWSPGYFSLSNLEIRNGYEGDSGGLTYTAFDGSVRAYGHGCGIYIEKGDHITFKNNIIHGNNEGFFGAGQGDQRNLEDILIESNHIYGNGTVSSSQQHNSYLEGINITYQFNKYGPLRNTSAGGGLKDRGAGTIIRYNWFQGGGHLLDLVESQNYQYSVVPLNSYRSAYVYGNVLYNTWPSGAATPVHYGGDGGVRPSYRKGILSFYNNTFVNLADQSQTWRVNIFKMSSSGESLDARNNIIAFLPLNTSTIPEINMLSNEGVGYFGRNWVNPTWLTNRIDGVFTGHIAGTDNFINNPEKNPGLISTTVGALDFHLVDSSQNVNQSLGLSADSPPVEYEYVEPYAGRVRSVVGSCMDMGAFEYGISDTAAPAAPIGLSVS